MEIRILESSDLADAALVVTLAMASNPIVAASLDQQSFKKPDSLQNFFTMVVRGVFDRGQVLGAFEESTLVGVCGITPPGACQPKGKEKLQTASLLVRSFSLSAVFRVLGWATEWTKNDPAERHWHLGPLAVDPAHQGTGIGDALLAAACEIGIEKGEPIYLETDRESNVGFYEKRGFSVIGQSKIHGVDNWYMILRKEN